MQRTDLWIASRLVNYPVRNSAGENIGKIEDVVIDAPTGRVLYAILSVGAVSGADGKLYVIPWASLETSARDSVLLTIDRHRLERAPSFDRSEWPDVTDPGWRRSINDYYGPAPAVQERRVYVERPAPRRGVPVLGVILLVLVVAALAWGAFLVSTRGWDQATQDIRSSLAGAAQAAKETTSDAALTTRVKTALSLSKRIPASQIDVDSEGNAVTLRGEVPDSETRALAESIALDVQGVGAVHNHLYVVSEGQ